MYQIKGMFTTGKKIQFQNCLDSIMVNWGKSSKAKACNSGRFHFSALGQNWQTLSLL